MRTIYSAAVSAALVVFSASLGQAASKPIDNSPATQARRMLEQVDSWSVSMVDRSDWLALTAKDPGYPDSRRESLDILKDDVNKIGRELRVLEAERGSLAEWESKAVDEVLPLMRVIAAYTEGAVETYNSDRDRLFATSFPTDTANLFADAVRVKELLDGHLKLAAVREQEQRIENEVDASR